MRPCHPAPLDWSVMGDSSRLSPPLTRVCTERLQENSLADQLSAVPSAPDRPLEPAFAPHPPGFRLRRGRNWFFLGLMYASYYLCRRNLGIISPELTKTFKFTNEQYGGIQTGRDGGYAIGQLINGLFTDRLGGKRAMAVGALGTILMNVVFGLTTMTGISWMLIALVL